MLKKLQVTALTAKHHFTASLWTVKLIRKGVAGDKVTSCHSCKTTKNVNTKIILHTMYTKKPDFHPSFALHFVKSVSKPKSVVSLCLCRCVRKHDCNSRFSLCKCFPFILILLSGILGMRMYRSRARWNWGQNDFYRLMFLFSLPQSGFKCLTVIYVCSCVLGFLQLGLYGSKLL